jgi:hypothetical protein
MLAAREVEPGLWYMIDGLDRPYGEIRFVRRGDELGYRADRTSNDGTVTQHVGYFRTFRSAAWAIHAAFTRSHGAPSRMSCGA